MEVKLVKRGKSSFQRREGKVSKHKTNKVKFVYVALLNTTGVVGEGVLCVNETKPIFVKTKRGDDSISCGSRERKVKSVSIPV